MPSPADMPPVRPDRVEVFIDYENVRRTALGAFCDRGMPSHAGMIDPIALAELICARRKRPSILGRVYVYRGKPSPIHQPTASSYFDRYAAAWDRDARCQVRSRDLKYRWHTEDDFTAQEKGIDVWLATELIAHSLDTEAQAVVVVSSDTDLLPAVEYVLRDTPMHIEVAAWAGPGSFPLFLRNDLNEGRKRPYCHYLNKADFEDLGCDGLFG